MYFTFHRWANLHIWFLTLVIGKQTCIKHSVPWREVWQHSGSVQLCDTARWRWLSCSFPADARRTWPAVSLSPGHCESWPAQWQCSTGSGQHSCQWPSLYDYTGKKTNLGDENIMETFNWMPSTKGIMSISW